MTTKVNFHLTVMIFVFVFVFFYFIFIFWLLLFDNLNIYFNFCFLAILIVLHKTIIFMTHDIFYTNVRKRLTVRVTVVTKFFCF